MKKLKQFLLVDDSKPTNFINKTIINKVDCVDQIVVVENGKEALDHIKSGEIPEVIFLDINMPLMNGWEFISNYQQLEEHYKGSIIVLMIGAELNQEEKDLAESISEIKEQREKILTKEVVCDILGRYFENQPQVACL